VSRPETLVKIESTSVRFENASLLYLKSTMAGHSHLGNAGGAAENILRRFPGVGFPVYPIVILRGEIEFQVSLTQKPAWFGDR
jgi:hypothetical protein